MTFLPIVERELRVAARRRGTVRLRFFAALLAMGVMVVMLAGSSPSTPPQKLARHLFEAVSILAFGFSLIAGIFLTADCLCSERREGTLGLLFLTDLKSYDVVLGKLAATSIASVYAFLAVIPMLGLPLLMGGVSFGEFGRVTLVVLMTLFLSLATGMLASAICRDTRAAMLLTFGAMLSLTGVLFVAAQLAGMVLGRAGSNLLLLPSPLLAFTRTSDSTFLTRTGFDHFWAPVVTLFGLALLQLIAACLLVSRLSQPKELESRPKKEPSTQPRTLHVCGPPFFWLLDRDGFPGGATRVGFVVLFLVWLVFYLGPYLPAFNRPGRRPEEMFITAFFIAAALHICVKGLMAVQATRRLCEDRRSGALELLLATSLSPDEILSSHRQALRQQFRGFNLALTVINLALVWMVCVGRPFNMEDEIALVFSAFYLGGIVLLWVDFNAITWIGMWMALRGLRPHRAVLHTLGRVLLPPWIAVFLLFVLARHGGGSPPEVLVWWLFWLALSISSAYVAAAHPRRELRRRFRQLAAGEPSAR